MKPADIPSAVQLIVDGIAREQVRSFVEERLVEFFRTDHAGRVTLAFGLQEGRHGAPVSDLFPEGSRRFRRALLLRREFTPAVIDILADRARRGNEDAAWVLQEHAAQLRTRDQPIPPALGTFLNEKPPGKRGRKIGDCEIRNMKILAAIDLLVHGCGYNATRNANLKFQKGVPDESACEVVARALGRARVNISGRGVEKIWERSGRTGTGTRSKKAPELYEIEIKIDSPSDP